MALPPGPPFPALVNLIWTIVHPTSLWEYCARHYGKAFTYSALGLGKWISFTAPDALRQLFAASPEALQARQGSEIMRPIFGARSIFLVDGAPHLRLRRLVVAPLHGEQLRAHFNVMREITEQAIRDWPLDRPFHLRPRMKAITMYVILRAIFGVEEGPRLDRIASDLTELLGIAGSPFLLLTPSLLSRAPLGPWRRFRELSRRTSADIGAEIRRRRAAHARVDRHDVLSTLLHATDEQGRPFSDEELHDQLMSLLFAGHETTELALTWTFQLIAAHPEVAGRLDRELASVSGPEGLDLEALMTVEYLDAVIRESLRLWPVVPVLGRRVCAPVEIAGYQLPIGVNASPCIYLTHRDPTLYPDPQSFRPERFLGRRPDPFVWLPFGGGDRRCAGMHFALAEMKIVVATVLTRVRLGLAPGPRGSAVRRGVLLAPSERTQFVLTRLEQAQDPGG